MIIFKLQSNKGVYSILTTFSFIIVVLFVVLSVIYYGSYIFNISSASNDELNKFQIIRDTKNRLYYCYGQVFDVTKLNTVPCEISSDLIKGYTITKLDYGNCTKQEWKYREDRIQEAIIGEIYIVAIKDNGFNCPGKVQVFI